MSVIQYKEITPYPEATVRWKELTINAGASQSTLQDIKLPEGAGCFTYKDSGNLSSPTSNRFIYWRTNNDVIELVEVSLDVNLRGNHVRLRFQHTPVLQGVSFHETHDQVIILIATVSTIHKVCLPHPRKLLGKDYLLQQANVILPSIFFDISLASLRDQSNCFILNHASVGIPLPHTSCSWLAPNGDAAFVLANSVGSLLLVIMGSAGKITTAELKKTSVMSRLWSGLVPVAMRGGQGNDVALSIVSHQDGSDVLIFVLCRDLRIRMWSYNKQECLMSASVLEYCGETGTAISWNFTAQQCCLRKTVDSTGSNLYLGVFVSFPEQNQFCIFQPLYITDQYRLSHISTLNSPQYDLVDFCLSMSHVWTLWLNSESEPVIKVTAIESDELLSSQIEWLSVDLQPPVARDVYVNLGVLDSREAYLKEIFQQGRFSPYTISKAIMIYRRVGDSSFSVDLMQEMETLKEEAVKAVEYEIQMKASETDLSDETYNELQIQCWDRFFSYCIQYHEVGTKPLGIALDPATGCVMVVKKNIYSLLRPCDAVEQLILSNVHPFDSSAFSNNPAVSEYKKEDPALCLSLVGVMQCLSVLSKSLTEDMLKVFEQDLFYLHSPEDIATEFVKELSVMPSDTDNCLLTKLQLEIQAVPNIFSALQHLLRWMDVGLKAELYDINDYDIPQSPMYCNFLSGESGVSVLCEGVSQFAKERFAFCRNLLLLEHLINQLEEMGFISIEKSEKILSETVPYTAQLVRAYYSVMWCTECACIPVQPAILESGLQQLSLLELPEHVNFSKGEKGSIWGSTIVHLFLSEQGGNQARHLMSLQAQAEECMENKWSSLLPILISNAVQLLWPLGPHFLFPEFLFTQCQYLPLQGYARLLGRWCEWNNHSMKFLSASSLLTLGEHWKARDMFCQVPGGLEKDDFLHAKIMQGANTTSASIIAQYYMKVIQLFEYLGLSDLIISLATTAITTVDQNDPYIPVFWSLVFKHHLELGHDDEAYTAMIRNPDPSRQKDCLRQLSVVLCERRRFQKLINFPYSDMLDDVISILESRARSCDLMRQNYYDLLYSFHIHTNNFRKAASISYEYGMRLSQEVSSLAGLKKQASCYLATINSLLLVDPRYAWIVKPVHKATISDNAEHGAANSSPKRNSDGDEVQYAASTQKIQVLELDDIRREYQLIHARLLLSGKDSSPTNITTTPLSASDTVTLLVNAGLFDVAVTLCKAFKLSLTPVFEGIAYRCVIMVHYTKSQHAAEDDLEILEWLGQNDTTALPTSSYVSGQDQVWYLLKNYLELYEMPGQTLFHRCVASKLLSASVQLPAWFKRSYQCHNAAELLWLYISHGLLENATDLAVDYIDAVLGNGKEDFGIEHALHASMPPVWLPHTYLDALLEALEEVQNDYTNCTPLYRRLTEKLNYYNDAVDSVTEVMMIQHHTADYCS